MRRHYGITVGRTAGMRTRELNEIQWHSKDGKVFLLFNEAVGSERPRTESGVIRLEGRMMEQQLKTGTVQTRLQSCFTLNPPRRLHIIQKMQVLFSDGTIVCLCHFKPHHKPRFIGSNCRSYISITNFLQTFLKFGQRITGIC